MLYQLLAPYAHTFILFNLFHYITFRTVGALATSLIICFAFGPRIIAWLRKKQGEGQPIRLDGPETHLKKKGTPTMGGLMILIAVTVSTLLWADLSDKYTWIVLFVTIGFGLVGFADDYHKLTKRSHLGVPAKVRLASQLFLASLAVIAIVYYAAPAQATMLAIPFVKDFMLQLGWFFLVFAVFVIVGASNAVNLTDGLDGLATVPVMIVALCFGIIAYLVGNLKFADYLQIHHVIGAGELSVFCGALVGACLGFLWYNAPPAQVFMGDTGSLALGGAFGIVAVLIHQPFVLVIAGGIFVAEALSVILQKGWFKYTRLRTGTGRRIFLMSPLHHHFEKKGWHESQIVMRFYILCLLCAVAALATLKLR